MNRGYGGIHGCSYYGKDSEGGCPVSVTETSLESIYAVRGIRVCLMAGNGLGWPF